jgi:SAM-dependent methyltransferase
METQWFVYPPPSSQQYKENDLVFTRTKTAKELGKRGRVVNTKDGRVEVEISLVPGFKCCGDLVQAKTYSKSFRPARLVPFYRESKAALQLKCKVLLTKTTSSYRLLAASQLSPTDHVLEIGCSNGECSIVIEKYAHRGNLVGIDTSAQMIAEAEKKLEEKVDRERLSGCSVKFIRLDPFMDPQRCLEDAKILKDEDKKNFSMPNVIFIDIGGNRDMTSVVLMTSWVESAFSPEVIIIKSEEMIEEIEKLKCKDRCNRQEDGRKEKKRCKINEVEPQVEPDGLISNGNAWFQCLADKVDSERITNNSLPPKYKHPLKAPIRMSPLDANVPICRYHNYHKGGCKKGSKCPLDHEFCHWCLGRGHTATKCLGVTLCTE